MLSFKTTKSYNLLTICFSNDRALINMVSILIFFWRTFPSSCRITRFVTTVEEHSLNQLDIIKQPKRIFISLKEIPNWLVRLQHKSFKIKLCTSNWTRKLSKNKSGHNFRKYQILCTCHHHHLYKLSLLHG